MRQLARVREQKEAFQESGTVMETGDGGALTVRTESGMYGARRAFSCLVEPMVGDVVLLSGLPGGQCYVLAVLERESDAPARLVSEGNLEVRLPRGRFVVAAQEGVDLVSAQEVSVTAGGVRVHATEGNVVVRQLSVLGAFVRAEFDRIKVMAESCDSVFDRMLQRVKRSYRFVEEHDQVRAAQIDYVAQNNASLRGENTLITAKDLIKVDGEQIHLG
ncbi:DUF3540 domain-containing protein [Hyalangium rubrum]|uniref:DUF3540 domain-containing protein n=1 Tax=Hyalangium rubrum TaxID=3103134 RepID=A0ABU5GVC6_9BACT|nr:DUF3540 domain-containing protein [Hyalangium sp. s54d21]MDY7224857.1 DUF3540 domain-containing protein [Hyalangium sp. s54d21]